MTEYMTIREFCDIANKYKKTLRFRGSLTPTLANFFANDGILPKKSIVVDSRGRQIYCFLRADITDELLDTLTLDYLVNERCAHLGLTFENLRHDTLSDYFMVADVFVEYICQDLGIDNHADTKQRLKSAKIMPSYLFVIGKTAYYHPKQFELHKQNNATRIAKYCQAVKSKAGVDKTSYSRTTPKLRTFLTSTGRKVQGNRY